MKEADDPRLDAYRKARSAGRTPEPKPDSARGDDARPLFVIQEHHASRLHWDLRLAIDGVLVSWAVPKGPSTDPREKRLAVRTEDHPLAYADFEGVIPDDAYGAGVVVVWDRGPYRNLRADERPPVSMSDALDGGHIEVELSGEKLSGGYALIHAELGGDPKSWILVKMRDEAADARRNPTSTEPRSVLSGRTARELASEADPE